VSNVIVKNPFIKYLYALVETSNRAALADLRRGLSGQPGTSPAMFQYVAPWVPEDARNTWKEKVYYIIASLFAYYQAGASGKVLTTDQGNFGTHCRPQS
jgi:CRISPR type I-E-associated protein CasB/Cse2